MNTPRNPRWAETWTFEAIQRFVDTATKKEVAALRDTFERQADLMRRHEKEESAAFWEALSNSIAAAADASKRDAA